MFGKCWAMHCYRENTCTHHDCVWFALYWNIILFVGIILVHLIYQVNILYLGFNAVWQLMNSVMQSPLLENMNFERVNLRVLSIMMLIA